MRNEIALLFLALVLARTRSAIITDIRFRSNHQLHFQKIFNLSYVMRAGEIRNSSQNH